LCGSIAGGVDPIDKRGRVTDYRWWSEYDLKACYPWLIIEGEAVSPNSQNHDSRRRRKGMQGAVDRIPSLLH